MKWFLVFLLVVQTGENTQRVIEGKTVRGWNPVAFDSREDCLTRSRQYYQHEWKDLPPLVLDVYTRCELLQDNSV